MTKKFMSLLLAVVMVIGLMSTMGVQAAGGTTYLVDDFENYNSDDVWYDSASGTTGVGVYDKNNVRKWRANGSIRAEIVTMPGYDGDTTQAMKITLANHDGKMGGEERFYAYGGTANTTGIQVVEAKFYIPDGAAIKRFSFGQIRKYGAQLDLSADDNDVDNDCFSIRNKWVKITLVVNLDTDESIVYINDNVASYHEYSVTKSIFPSYLQVAEATEGSSVILDDVVMYHTPSATTASSNYANQDSVVVTDKPTINFTEMLLNTEINDVATISDANIIMTTSDADGSQNIPKTWEVSDDNKSITIKPNADLEKGTSYKVKLTGLKDMYDVIIPDYEFTFTTQDESPIVVSSAEFSKVSLTTAGTPETTISTLEEGYINARITIKNDRTIKEKTQSLTVIAVLKDGNQITGFQFKEATLNPDDTLSFDGGFWVTDADTQKIEFYIWSSLNGMFPLAENITFDKTGVKGLAQ